MTIKYEPPRWEVWYRDRNKPHIFINDKDNLGASLSLYARCGMESICGRLRMPGIFDRWNLTMVTRDEQGDFNICRDCLTRWSAAYERPFPWTSPSPEAARLELLETFPGGAIYSAPTERDGRYWFKGPFTVIWANRIRVRDCTCTEYFYSKMSGSAHPAKSCSHLVAAMERYRHDTRQGC